MKPCAGSNYDGCPHAANAGNYSSFCMRCQTIRYGHHRGAKGSMLRGMKEANEVEPETIPTTKIDAFVTKLSNYAL